jgi:UDP-N-acetylglucosamine transferase subunit ALG13
LIILSGPEPQRTIFEDKIVKQLKAHTRNAVLVRGLPAEGGKMEDIEGLRIFNYMAADQLNELICNSGLIICRSGYTSVMDMLKLRKKMVVVPTPGQAEQEYLASHLSGRRLAVAMQQNNFSIEAAVQIAAGFNFQLIEENMEAYKEVIKDFALQIMRNQS